jgi:hypothetical protein
MDEIVEMVRRWFVGERRELNLAKQVRVTKVVGATGDMTRVRIDHRIPSHDSGGRAGWRITTREQFLPRAHFDVDVRREVNSASAERGRRVYCIEQHSGEVVAAIAYHVDKNTRIPVMVTAIGLRIDSMGTPELFSRSRGAAYVLKQYVHEIARQLGRGSFVDIDAGSAATRAEAQVLGFRPAPTVRGLRISGTHLRQQGAGVS